MADSIDPEILRQINENLAAMSEMIGRTNSTMGDFAKNINSMGGAAKQYTDATNSHTTAQKNATPVAKALADAEKEAQQEIDDFNKSLKAAGGSAVMALGSFGDALLSGQKGFAKYNSAIGSAGDAALELGKSFGPAGTAAGALAKAFTMVTQAVLKQLDDQIGFRDSLSKSGAALGQSVDKLAGLGRAAGYSSADLEKLVKPLQTVGKNLVALGGTAGEGASKFLEVANAGSDVRKEFRNLGMSYEELTQNQADYLAQQQLSVIALKSETIGRETLKNASLEYTENLVKLSALTGKNADQLKQEQLVNQQKFEEVLKERQENVKIAKLRKEGSNKEADDILAQQQARKALINRVTAEQGEAAGAAVGQMARTGTINKDTAKYATQTGMNAKDLQNQIQGTRATYDAQNKLDLVNAERQGDAYGKAASNKIGEATDKQATALGDTIGIAGEGAAKNLLIGNKEGLQSGQAQAGMTAEERDAQRAKIDQDTELAKQGKDAQGREDAKSQAAANLQEREIKARIATDDLINKASQHLTLLTVAMGALTVAVVGLTGVMAKQSLSKMFSVAGGIGGGGSGFFSKMTKPLTGVTGGATEGIMSAAGGVEKAASGKLPTLTKAAEGGAGKGVGLFIKGIGEGLSAVGKEAPMVLAGAAAVGGSITLIGAGIAGATWIIGAALPKFAKGLEAFNDVDGENLKQAGLGMAGLGAGVLALGAGAALNAMTGLAKLFTGQKDPLTEAAHQLLTFQSYNIDGAKVKNNADAFVDFSTAMAKGAALQAAGDLAGLAGSVASGVSAFFGGEKELPIAKFVDFAKLDIPDSKAVKDKADSFVAFADAMSKYQGGADEGIGSAISNSITDFFSTELPYDKFIKFANLNVKDPKRVKDLSDAFVAFSTAMSHYKGGPNAGTLSSIISGSAYKFFKENPPTKKFEEFGKLDINPEKTTKNSQAFVNFANAMGSYKGGPGAFTALSSLVGAGLTKLFGGDGPLAAFEKFAKMDFGTKAESNSDAFYKYAQSMGIISSSRSGGGGGGGAAGAAGGGGGAAGAAGGGGGGGGGAADAGGAAAGGGGGAGGANAGTGGTAGGGAGSGPADTGGSGSSERFTNTAPGEGGGKSGRGAAAAGGSGGGDISNATFTIGKPKPAFLDVMKTAKKTGDPHPEITASQWALESGWGKHMSGKNNPFGQKAKKRNGQPIEPATLRRTREVINGKDIYINDYFKDFPSLDDAIGDHVVKWTKRKTTPGSSPVEAAQAIKSAGYATDPNYVRSLSGIVASNGIDPKAPLKAKAGGMFNGPSTGYPMELHGSELVAPLDPQSILMKLAKEPAKPEAISNATKDPLMGLSKAFPDLIHTMSTKLDKVISVLENSHKTNEKILKHTKV
jgi:hypothetical protein